MALDDIKPYLLFIKEDNATDEDPQYILQGSFDTEVELADAVLEYTAEVGANIANETMVPVRFVPTVLRPQITITPAQLSGLDLTVSKSLP